ncbi:SusC/RagA family TonB-linked outer membrane protein [Chitinophaga oryzae]|uniref:SusC/RagA family TonB-linked outer membrane protein n=1 Tax=Chitinophaga oryzae TaxID=2725414 RepID=A0AAE6ZH36_9BACT|nr:SusC/RagA family TonB-linked outer membrane protein [Chitinophaga oryzae]QJB32571.1 SusC/RagA family TonB-linked outer membrane protein [Chitinophaga oryzae]
MKHKSVIHVLQLIREKTGIEFFYNIEELKNLPPVSLAVSEETVDNILRLLLKDCPLHIEKSNGFISIIPNRNSAPSLPATTEVTGLVTDTAGAPLSQANIIEQGTVNGVQSDNNGRFRISVKHAAVLQFSYLGMRSVSVTITNQPSLHVKMQPLLYAINEVTANGYVDVKKRYSAASIASLRANGIDRPDLQTIDQMLEGKIAGLNINMNSTAYGAAPKIRLRGTATLLGNREPIWVIDGIVADPPVKLNPETINSLDQINLMSSAVIGLNPKDIERIDVLKDATSTALYGVNGGNGVIVITTRKGAHNSAPRMTFSQMANITFRPTYKHLDMMDGAQRTALSKYLIDRKLLPAYSIPQGFDKDYLSFKSGNMSADEFNKLEQTYQSMNTDWFNILFNNGVSQRYNVSVNGGRDKTAYYLSLGHANQQGPAIFTSGKQYSGMLAIDQRITPNFQAGIKISGSKNQATYPYQTDPYQYAYHTARNIPLSRDGQRFYYTPYIILYLASPNIYQQDSIFGKFNILSEMENSRTLMTVNACNVRINTDWTFLRFFRLSGLYGIGSSDTDESSYAGESTYSIASRYRFGLTTGTPYIGAMKDYIILPEGGEYQQTYTRKKNYSIRHSLEYNLDKGHHFLQLVAGNELRGINYNISSSFILGYYPERGKIAYPPPADEYPAYNRYFQATGKYPHQEITKQYRLLSWYGMLVYSYKNRYTFNGSLRADNSNFLLQTGPSYTWSAAFKWDITSELWMPTRSSSNTLAFRLSYGYNNGLPEISPPRLTLTTPTQNINQQEPQSTLNAYPKRTMGWEKIYIFNAALDFSFFNNRFTGVVESYRKQSNDLLAYIDVPEENGMLSFPLNNASLLNYGFETNLRWELVKHQNWQVDVGATISLGYSKILHTNFTDPGINGSARNYLNGNIVMSGTDPNTMYAFRFTGLNKSGAPTFRGLYSYDYSALPTSAQYFSTVFVPVGSRIPAVDGSFYTSIRYKNWCLSATFLVKLGYKQRLNNLYGTNSYVPNSAENSSNVLQQSWANPGDEQHTNIPVYAIGTQYLILNPLTLEPQPYTSAPAAQVPLYPVAILQSDIYNNSDIRTVSGGHVRLSSLSLQYTVLTGKNPKRIFKDMSCYLQGHDLLLIADKRFHGQDPELLPGVMPRRPSLTLGTNIKF